jgi:ATP-dependent DNA helicase RecQ
VWGDAGWGQRVRHGTHVSGRFDDALVTASAELIRAWAPQPAPSWVTCVPSRTRPQLVADFAQRLAGALGLAFHPVLAKTEQRPEQRAMANSPQQARNIDGSLALTVDELPDGPVLLVDDRVDSRWTLTIAAWLLLRAGSGPVWPLTLAKSGGGE